MKSSAMTRGMLVFAVLALPLCATQARAQGWEGAAAAGLGWLFDQYGEQIIGGVGDLLASPTTADIVFTNATGNWMRCYVNGQEVYQLPPGGSVEVGPLAPGNYEAKATVQVPDGRVFQWGPAVAYLGENCEWPLQFGF